MAHLCWARESDKPKERTIPRTAELHCSYFRPRKRSLNILNKVSLRASSTRTATMPSAITPPQESAPFYVPTVDIAPFLADPSSTEADKIIASVRAACISTGFFQITGHGIWRKLQKDVFKAAAAFFKLPFDEKKKLDAKTTIGHRGYDVLASQSYEADVLPDLKEVPNPEPEILIPLQKVQTPYLSPGLLYRLSIIRNSKASRRIPIRILKTPASSCGPLEVPS